MAVVLDQIVPWGRTGGEYGLMFGLTPGDLSGGVLDCGGGPASFVAELSASGVRAISVDPIYGYSGPEIAERFEATVEPMMSQVRATPGDWTWGYHRDPDHLCANRRAALEGFLADYDEGRREHRYVAGSCRLCRSGPARSVLWSVPTCCFCIPTCSPSPFTSARFLSCAA